MVTIKENAYFNPPHFLPYFFVFSFLLHRRIISFLLSFAKECSMSYIIFEKYEQNIYSKVALSNCNIRFGSHLKKGDWREKKGTVL